MDLRPHIEKFRKRFAEVEAALSDPKAFDNPQRAQELSREYARLKELLAHGDNYLKTLADLEQNRALLKSEPQESELAQMAREEVARLEVDENRWAQQIQFGILPPDLSDSRNTIIEIRAGPPMPRVRQLRQLVAQLLAAAGDRRRPSPSGARGTGARSPRRRWP